MSIFNIFNNDSTIIVNGKVINGSNNNPTSKKFNKTKREASQGVNCISIDSNIINVNVSTTDTDYIIAHLHGSAITDNDIDLSVTRDNNNIKISAQFEPNYVSTNFGFSSTTVVNMNNSEGLILDVKIPYKVFNGFHFQSSNANIAIDSSVKFNSVIVNTKDGKVDLSAAFQYALIDSHNGDITINSESRCDTINVKTHNAKTNISTPFNNLYITSHHDGNVNVNSTAYCDTIKVNTNNAETNISTPFKNLFITSHNGNVNVDSTAYSNTTLKIAVHNSSVSIALNNISTSYVTATTKNGKCKNNPRLGGKYTVSGCIQSYNGNITFH